MSVSMLLNKIESGVWYTDLDVRGTVYFKIDIPSMVGNVVPFVIVKNGKIYREKLSIVILEELTTRLDNKKVIKVENPKTLGVLYGNIVTGKQIGRAHV